MEGIEARYAQTKATYELRDLLFTLLAHMEPMRVRAADWATVVDWYEGVLRSAVWVKKVLGKKTRADGLFLKFVQVLESYALIIKERDCGQLEVTGTALTAAKTGVAAAGAKAVSMGTNKIQQQQMGVDDCQCAHKTPAGTAGPPASLQEPVPPPMGSLGYLAVVAHSTSRQNLHPEVKTALEAQFNTKKR